MSYPSFYQNLHRGDDPNLYFDDGTEEPKSQFNSIGEAIGAILLILLVLAVYFLFFYGIFKYAQSLKA